MLGWGFWFYGLIIIWKFNNIILEEGFWYISEDGYKLSLCSMLKIFYKWFM